MAKSLENLRAALRQKQMVTFNTNATASWRNTGDHVYEQTMLVFLKKWERQMKGRSQQDIGEWTFWYETSATGHIHSHAVWREPVFKHNTARDKFIKRAHKTWVQLTTRTVPDTKAYREARERLRQGVAGLRPHEVAAVRRQANDKQNRIASGHLHFCPLTDNGAYASKMAHAIYYIGSATKFR